MTPREFRRALLDNGMSAKQLTLTKRQMDVLSVVHDCRKEHGYSPTLQEIATALEIGHIAVFEYVEEMIKKRVLTKTRNLARSLSLTTAGEKLIQGIEHARLTALAMEIGFIGASKVSRETRACRIIDALTSWIGDARVRAACQSALNRKETVTPSAGRRGGRKGGVKNGRRTEQSPASG